MAAEPSPRAAGAPGLRMSAKVTGSSLCTFSPASRQSVMSFQRRGRLHGSSHQLALGAGPPGLTGGVGRKHIPRLVVDGYDVTPHPLYDMDDRPGATALDLLAGLTTLGPLLHSTASASSGLLGTVGCRESSIGALGGRESMAPSIGTSPGMVASVGASFGASLGHSLTTSDAMSVLSIEDRAPEQFALPKPMSLKGALPTCPVELIMRETPTFTLLEISSRSEPVYPEQLKEEVEEEEEVKGKKEGEEEKEEEEEETKEEEEVGAKESAGKEVSRKHKSPRKHKGSGAHKASHKRRASKVQAIEMVYKEPEPDEEVPTDHTRVFSDAEVQTAAVWTRSRGTGATRERRRNTACMVTSWDLYDTFEAKRAQPMLSMTRTTASQSLGERRALARRRRQLRRTVLDRISSQRSLSLSDIETHSMDSKEAERVGIEERLRTIFSSSPFRRAAMQVERILAIGQFRARQLLYRGIPAPDPLLPDLRFDYLMELLWTFESDMSTGRPVRCLAWSHTNQDLLAVGYGALSALPSGLVCVWSVKNPVMPERTFRLGSAVTSVSFARDRPNLLAVGHEDGTLTVLDVSGQAPGGVVSETKRGEPCWEALWKVTWMGAMDDDEKDAEGENTLSFDALSSREFLVTAGQDGRILRWTRGPGKVGMVPQHMMRIVLALGGERGVPPLLGPPVKLVRESISLRQHAAALCLEPEPHDSQMYLVGSDDGRIHECSTNYLHSHVSIISAHAGPIYQLTFSPFCSQLFLTCGADWAVRLWARGINEPLLTLASGSSVQAVEDVAWSPSNSTVLATVSGREVLLWDLRRKTHLPAQRLAWPWPEQPTTLSFTPSATGGDNLLVADSAGRVAVYALRDMPFPPYYQEAALVAAVKRALATKPELNVQSLPEVKAH